MGCPRPACAAEGEYSSVRNEERGKQMEANGDTRLLWEQHDRDAGHLPEVGRVGGQDRSTRTRVLLHR
jgi:hypothetical protein